nr:MAG TPA: hypothetical protein [Caudoviricetes sp.]
MSVSTLFYTAMGRVSKHAPTILSVGASIGVVATSALAWRAGRTFEDVEYRNYERIKACQDRADEIPDEQVPAIERKNRLAFALDAARHIAPMMIVGGTTIALIYFSNSISRKRMAALSAAYFAVQNAFDNYKAKMTETLGKETVDKIMAPKLPNIGKTAEEILSNDDRNDAADVTDAVLAMVRDCSPYARVISETSSTAWDPNEDYTLMNLTEIQAWANRRLEKKGHLFLNEVFDQLGLSRMKEGAIVGWLKKGEGDGYVSFGDIEGSVYRVPDSEHKSIHSNVILDFNVDGVIWDKI